MARAYGNAMRGPAVKGEQNDYSDWSAFPHSRQDLLF